MDFIKYLVPFLLLSPLSADLWQDLACLERDLEWASYCDQKQCFTFPVHYNCYMQGGLILMPSARVSREGTAGFSYSRVDPYSNYNLLFQYLPWLEVTGSYRVFSGIPDPLFGHHGFGDLSDKGVNVKWAFWKPEEAGYRIPSLAIGFDDILGTRAFKSSYIALTHVIEEFGLEATLGWGQERIDGFFGGLAWSPLWTHKNPWIRGITFVAEYDPTDYENDPHPAAREFSKGINWGVSYSLFDMLHLSVYRTQENNVSGSMGLTYNIGEMKGFLPKVDEKKPYSAPVCYTPLGTFRAKAVFSEELLFAMRDHGLSLLSLKIFFDSCNRKSLWIEFENEKYRHLYDTITQLTSILSHLLPDDIEKVVAVQSISSMPIQQFCFTRQELCEYANLVVCYNELSVLNPLKDASPPPCHAETLFERHPSLYDWSVIPRVHTFFGSAEGKFKYALGAAYEASGFLPIYDIYYALRLSYLFFSDINNQSSVDMLNPSQLIQVHTDIVLYEKQRGLRVDTLFLQKNWSFGSGFYAKAAAGFFNEGYFGGSFEGLYYPAQACWAVGVEASILKKRDYVSIFGLTNYAMKLEGFNPTYVYFTGTQFFLDLYYEWRALDLFFQLSAGQFLARDKGARIKIDRYFPSGLDLYFWYTFTNAGDSLNGETYYDKGVGFSMPLDIFYTSSSKTRFGYGMSAWLRDCGYRTSTGEALFPLIYYERQ